MLGEVIGAVIVGALAGYLGRALMPGKDPGGCVFTIALGIAGALIGYFLFTELLGIGDDDKFDLGGLIGAVLGVMLILAVLRVVMPRRDTPAAGPPPPGSPR